MSNIPKMGHLPTPELKNPKKKQEFRISGWVKYG